MIENKKIGDNSSGVQAGRDVTINNVNNHGLTLDDVKFLVEILLEQNFPKLRADAAREVTRNVETFLAEMKKQLESNYHNINQEKFKDPDIQFTLNEAVIEAAKRGSSANIDILVKLVLERVANDGQELLSLTCAEAIKVVSRLTPSHINFLSVLVFLEFSSIPNLLSIDQYEECAQKLDLASNSANLLSNWGVKYLESHGCLVHQVIGRDDIYKMFQSRHPVLKEMTIDSIKQDINAKTTYLKKLVDIYNKYRMNFLKPSLNGELIAMINLNSLLPGYADIRKVIK